MVNFFFASAHLLLTNLNLLISTSSRNMKLVEALGGQDDHIANGPKMTEAIDQAIKAVEDCACASEKLFADLKCPHIDKATQRLRNFLKIQFKWPELNTRSRALRDAVKVELGQYLYYQYPKQKGEKFRAWKDDWKNTLAAFPRVEMDVFSATDCYALQHNTASVFHSMRIAEHGMRALAKERRLILAKSKPIEWGTWQEIIKALDDEIKIIGGKKPGSSRDSALKFYSGARADLNGFKDEYRNLVAHVRATYDEHQAIRALTNVYDFMERLAARIDETHHRIRWGFR